MFTIPVATARADLEALIDEVTDNHRPVRIAGKQNSAVLVSEEDWQAAMATLLLMSSAEMRESIRVGLAEPLWRCSDDLDW